MIQTNFFKKFRQWEYWPSYMFYGPNLPYALYLAVKSGSLAFFSNVNPGIKSSGNGTESKFETLKMIPNQFKPKSIFVGKQRNIEEVLSNIDKAGIVYPLIAKPDIGFRGIFVKKLYNPDEVKDYLQRFPLNIIIQDFITLPNECGVFYHRFPNTEAGVVSSLTLKSFMKIYGDGHSNVEALVMKDKRAKHYYKRLRANNLKIWYDILENGKEVVLSEIGNHARGTQFIDGSHLIDKDLEKTFNELSNNIPNFYYGRFDIKYNSLEELKAGKNYQFLEVNGIIAEPIHIYDSEHVSFLNALKTFRNQWDILYKISQQNLKNGHVRMTTLTFWKEIIWLVDYVKKIKKLAHIRYE